MLAVGCRRPGPTTRYNQQPQPNAQQHTATPTSVSEFFLKRNRSPQNRESGVTVSAMWRPPVAIPRRASNNNRSTTASNTHLARILVRVVAVAVAVAGAGAGAVAVAVVIVAVCGRGGFRRSTLWCAAYRTSASRRSSTPFAAAARAAVWPPSHFTVLRL